MIFYFSGTGNSRFIAEKLLKDGEKLVSIASASESNEYSYDAGGEAVGFVFPVYFYNVPTFVESFISKLSISNASYVYAIICCGGSIKQAGNILCAKLAGRGIKLAYVRALKMPDNSMLFYQIPGRDKARKRIDAALVKLETYKKEISERKSMNIGSFTLISDILRIGYHSCMKTSGFRVVADRCISCGMCASNCPENVIEMKDGHPVWVKDKCGKCSACINRCPKEAIEYGRSTVGRNRYSFPSDYR